MPIFEYKCHKCKKVFEKIVKDVDEMVVCDCNYVTERLFPNKITFELKGDGWAKDGYQKKEKI